MQSLGLCKTTCMGRCRSTPELLEYGPKSMHALEAKGKKTCIAHFASIFKGFAQSMYPFEAFVATHMCITDIASSTQGFADDRNTSAHFETCVRHAASSNANRCCKVWCLQSMAYVVDSHNLNCGAPCPPSKAHEIDP